MATYFRLQYGHYSIEEMQNYTSEDGGDDGGTEGVCACESVSELMRNTVWSEDDGYEAEVVIMRGQRVERIYDGVRVYPTEIVKTMKPSEFAANADDIACNYEEW